MKGPVTAQDMLEAAHNLLLQVDKLNRENAIIRIAVELRDVYVEGMHAAIIENR